MAEFDLGTLNFDDPTPKLIRNFVGDNDTQDVISFSLGKTSNLNAALTGMSQDADLRLYRDVDGNGLLDEKIDIKINQSASSNPDESLNIGSLKAGKYLAEVERFAGADTNYELRVSATDPKGTSDSTSQTRASNLLATEVDEGILDSIGFSTRGFVENSDTADVYRFRAAESGDFHLDMTGLNADADVRVIRDFNNNKVVDFVDVIGSSTRAGTNSEAIDAFLTGGVNYFVQVYQFTGETSYTLEATLH